MKYLKCLSVFFLLIFKIQFGYSQITLNNPIETSISPSGKYLLAIISLDTLGFDDSVKPINVVVYNMETKKQLIKLENKIIDVANNNLIKWITDEIFYVNTPFLFDIETKNYLNKSIPTPYMIFGFSNKLEELLYLGYNLNTYTTFLMERSYGNTNIDTEIVQFDYMFDETDMVPPYDLDFKLPENQIGLVGYLNAEYFLYTFDFANQKLNKRGSYKPNKKWNPVKFILIDDTAYVHNKGSNELILLSDSVQIIAGNVNDIILANESLVFKRGDGLFCFKNEIYEDQKIVQDDRLTGKELIFSDGTNFIFKEVEGKNYLDPINYGTDYIVMVYKYNLNELRGK